MRSVAGAVTTGFNPRDGRDRQDCNPVATAPGTDVITIRRPLSLRRRRPFLSIQIDFVQAPFVLQDKGLWRVFAIQSYGLRHLIGDRDLIVILWSGDPDLGRRESFATGAKSLQLTIG